jgi:hypothetical protein
MMQSLIRLLAVQWQFIEAWDQRCGKTAISERAPAPSEQPAKKGRKQAGYERNIESIKIEPKSV